MAVRSACSHKETRRTRNGGQGDRRLGNWARALASFHIAGRGALPDATHVNGCSEPRGSVQSRADCIVGVARKKVSFSRMVHPRETAQSGRGYLRGVFSSGMAIRRPSSNGPSRLGCARSPTWRLSCIVFPPLRPAAPSLPSHVSCATPCAALRCNGRTQKTHPGGTAPRAARRTY